MKKFSPFMFVALLLVGCATENPPATTPAIQGGSFYKNPHMENVWLADGFNFKGYDTAYVADTKSTAHFQADEAEPHEIAKKNLQSQLANALDAKRIFAKVVTREADIPAGAKVLTLENTIIAYSKGGGAARYFAGMMGGGQPTLKVRGKMTDANKPVFSYEARRSGVSAGARVVGAFKTDVDIQSEDIESMVKDLTDFIEETAKGQVEK